MYWNVKWQIKTENVDHIVPSNASHRFFSSMYLRFITLTSRLAFALSFFNCVIRCSSLIGTFVINCVLSVAGFCVEPLEDDCASSSSSSRILKFSQKNSESISAMDKTKFRNKAELHTLSHRPVSSFLLREVFLCSLSLLKSPLVDSPSSAFLFGTTWVFPFWREARHNTMVS